MTLLRQCNSPDNAAVLLLAGCIVGLAFGHLTPGDESIKKMALRQEAAKCKHMAHCISSSCRHRLRRLAKIYRNIQMWAYC